MRKKYRKMLLLSMLLLFLQQLIYINALDLNSILPQLICFKEKQRGCNRDFTDVYKQYSTSVTNYTKADTFMLLYTRKNPDEPEKLHKCAGRLPPNSNYNPNNRLLVMFMQFFLTYCNSAVYREWTQQLLQKEDLNIIVIDYSWGNAPDPGEAIQNIRQVVRYQVDILLKNIQEQVGPIDKSKITFIGHSLGAQLAGLVANSINVSRIIGIDPAGPGHMADKTPEELRLDLSDADLVEFWHTNAGSCLPFIGTSDDTGHVNYYFNGGSFQYNCRKSGLEAFLRGDYVFAFALLPPFFCSHVQAPLYFKASINPGKCTFVGIKCDSYADFKLGKCRSCGPDGENCLIAGWDTDKVIKEIPQTPQKYYIETTLDCPYCDTSYLQLDGYEETYKSVLQS